MKNKGANIRVSDHRVLVSIPSLGSIPVTDLREQPWRSHHCFHQQSPPCALVNLPSPVQPQDHFANAREKKKKRYTIISTPFTFTSLKSTQLSVVIKDT